MHNVWTRCQQWKGRRKMVLYEAWVTVDTCSHVTQNLVWFVWMALQPPFLMARWPSWPRICDNYECLSSTKSVALGVCVACYLLWPIIQGDLREPTPTPNIAEINTYKQMQFCNLLWMLRIVHRELALHITKFYHKVDTIISNQVYKGKRK